MHLIITYVGRDCCDDDEVIMGKLQFRQDNAIIYKASLYKMIIIKSSAVVSLSVAIFQAQVGVLG